MATIGILGGTGPAGSGLGLWLARAGNRVILGSRDAARAAEVAETLSVSDLQMSGSLSGCDNATAGRADVVVLATPWTSARTLLEPLANHLVDKLVVSMINPIAMSGGQFVSLVTPSGSAALSVAHWLPRSRVVAAFHHVPASIYHEAESRCVVDVLVASSSQQDFGVLAEITAGCKSLKLWNAGDLSVSATLESMTPMILNLNRRYDTLGAIQFADYRQPLIDLSQQPARTKSP